MVQYVARRSENRLGGQRVWTIKRSRKNPIVVAAVAVVVVVVWVHAQGRSLALAAEYDLRL